MLQGLEALPRTPRRVIVLISKPPHPTVAERVLGAAARAGKPIVVNFLGADPDTVRRENVHPVRTLEDAARLAVVLAGGADAGAGAARTEDTIEVGLAPGQIHPRALQRRHLLLRGAAAADRGLRPDRLEHAARAGADARRRLAQPAAHGRRSRRRCLHPRPSPPHDRPDAAPGADPAGGRRSGGGRDPVRRRARLRRASGSRKRAGRHPRGGELWPAAGRSLALVGSVCGTAGDPQDLPRQEAALREAGVLLAESNAQAVRLAARIAARPRSEPGR